MLRFKILASTIPLLLAAILSRGDLSSATHPCIAIGESSVQMAIAPWQAQRHVTFTDDPARATVRVQIVDSAEAADFAVVDDVDSAGAGCAVTAATRFVAISATASSTEPVIYLSNEANADYRIFVQSRSFSQRDAAALIVSAHPGREWTTQAAL